MRDFKRLSASHMVVVAVCLIGSTFSCSSDSPSGPDAEMSGNWVIERGTPESSEIIAGSSIGGPAIRVKDKRSGTPIPGVLVDFRAVPALSSSVENPSIRTDASGLATAGEWRVPARAGTYELNVLVRNLSTSFTAKVRAASPFIIQALDTTIAGLAGGEVAGPVMLVTDRFNNPTEGAKVVFDVVSGNGTLQLSSAKVDANGKASPGKWRLGSTPGENAVVARVDGIEPSTFRTHGVDGAAMDWYVLDTIENSAPSARGISQSRLGLTRFDSCLCRTASGYYILEVEATRWFLTRTSGHYSVEPPMMHLRGEVGIQWSKSYPDPRFLMVDQLDSFSGDRIEVGILRWFPEWWEWWPETWIYKKQD